MKLWTLALASAFVWLVTPVAAFADAEQPAAAAPEVATSAPADEVAAQDLPQRSGESIVPGSEDAQPTAVPAEPVAAAAAAAPEAAPAAADAATAPSWEDFDDKRFDPTQAAPAEQQTSAKPARVNAKAAAIPLGPMAVDAKGVVGRIHTVNRGDTLWDISEAYLGTPWVWPSVWDENEAIHNPHRINPGDRIWITSTEMRRVSDSEAEQMISDANQVADAPEAGEEMEFVDGGETLAVDEEPLPAAVEDESTLSAAVPLAPEAEMGGAILALPRQPDANFASADTMEEAGEIVDAPTIRVYLTQGDVVYLDLGEGEVSVGDQFTAFHDIDKIRDTETGAVLGYHYDDLGWLEVTKVEAEASIAVIRGAQGDIARGDRLLPRVLPPREVMLRSSSDDIEGAIVFTPGYRWLMGQTDSVYLNVGAIHGVEVGAQMEVYDPGEVKKGSQMPDTVYAHLVVISVEPETSVAFVTQTDRELEIGDDIRAVTASELAAR